MNFEKIDIYGFKSFADKVEIKFEPGITAIVGPNGCGKVMLQIPFVLLWVNKVPNKCVAHQC